MFSNNVNVVLVGSQEKYLGMAIAWATQVAKQHLLISIPQQAAATQMLLNHEKFSVSVLADKQKDLARYFGGKGCLTAQASHDFVVEFSEENIPIIKHCQQTIICEKVACHEVETQLLVTAKVIDLTVNDELQALIYHKADYFA